MLVRARKTTARTDRPQFSDRAVFEALVNAVAHRDYSVAGARVRLHLFGNRIELYTCKGRNDKIPLVAIASVIDSLRLIRIDRLDLVAGRPGEAFGNNKRRVQGRFRHAETQYALWVTDPRYERKYLSKLDGIYELGECYLTISLGEPYEEYCLQAGRDHRRG